MVHEAVYGKGQRNGRAGEPNPEHNLLQCGVQYVLPRPNCRPQGTFDFVVTLNKKVLLP